MLKQAVILLSFSLMLGACDKDKFYTTTELGGGSSGSGTSGSSGSSDTGGSSGSSGPSGNTGATGAVGTTGAVGATGPAGLEGAPGSILGTSGIASSGLGLAGDEQGTIYNLLGADPVGALLEDTLGEDNGVSQILGVSKQATSDGLIPETFAALNGDETAMPLGDGLGLGGSDGLVSDLLGSDLTGELLGTEGILAQGVSGGQDGLLGSLLDDTGLSLDPVTGAVPDEAVTELVASLPALGVTDTGGLSEDLLGNDLIGNLLGTESGIGGILSGGEAGTLGDAIQAESLPLAAAGDVIGSTLDAGAGTGPNLVASTQAIAGDVLGGNAGGLPVIGDVLGGDAAGNLPVIGEVLSGDAGNLPVVGDVLGGDTGSLPVVGDVLGGGGLPAETLNDTVAAVTEPLESAPVVGGLVSGVTGLLP